MLDNQRLWTRNELIHESTRLLKEANITDSLRNVEWMLCELLSCSRAQLYAYPEREIPIRVLRSLNQMLKRRAKYEPLQYILGYTEFYGLRIDVAPGVLIPRPETELLVEEALKSIKRIEQPIILDIGTGSGCIALALKHERPDASVAACDISEEALTIASANARKLDLTVEFFQCDIREGIDRSTHFDLIISNPPYIPPSEKPSIDREVKDFEPELALFVNEDPLEYYRAVTHVASLTLRERGILCFETHTDYTADVKLLVEHAGFAKVQLLNDLTGRPRIIIGEK